MNEWAGISGPATRPPFPKSVSAVVNTGDAHGQAMPVGVRAMPVQLPNGRHHAISPEAARRRRFQPMSGTVASVDTAFTLAGVPITRCAQAVGIRENQQRAKRERITSGA